MANIIINDAPLISPSNNTDAVNNPLSGLTISISNETEISYLNNAGGEIKVRGAQENVSNYTYEVNLNEENRKILLLKTEYLGVFLGDMKNIMSYAPSSETIDSKTKKVYNSKLTGV